MLIEIFARTNRVVLKPEGDELMISGRHGYIFDYQDGKKLGIALLDNPQNRRSKARTLLCLRRKAIAAGFVPRQTGDAESVFEFDPWNREQGETALALVGVHRRRRLSHDHRLKLLAASQATQYSATRTVLEPDLQSQERERRSG